jgi:hypothetical protein
VLKSSAMVEARGRNVAKAQAGMSISQQAMAERDAIIEGKRIENRNAMRNLGRAIQAATTLKTYVAMLP